MEKTVITFGDIEIETQKLHQHKRPISIKNIDINKIVVSKSSLIKRVLNISMSIKMLKFDLYVYFSRK